MLLLDSEFPWLLLVFTFIRKQQLVPLTTKKYFKIDKIGTSSELVTNKTWSKITLRCLINEEPGEFGRCEIPSNLHVACKFKIGYYLWLKQFPLNWFCINLEPVWPQFCSLLLYLKTVFWEIRILAFSHFSSSKLEHFKICHKT